MRKLIVLITFLHLSLLIAFAQDKPVVESVEISGVADSRITSDLRDMANSLMGQPFDQLEADEIGYRLQKELSERISAIRQVPGSDAGHIKVVFEFSGQRGGIHINFGSNVNERYTVDEVKLHGIDESVLSDRLRDEMQQMVGHKLDDDLADRVRDRLSRELRPNHLVSKRIEKGSERDHIRLIYDVTKAPLLSFARKASDSPSTENYIVYNSKQSWSFNVDGPIEHHNNRLDVGAVNDGDALLERFAGWWTSFENIKAGTEHLGFRVEYHDYHDKWKFATQEAVQSIPDTPGIYRERRGVEPSVTVAIDHRLRFSVGASVTEMQFQYPVIHFQNANAGTASVTYDDSWRRTGDADQFFTANYSVHTASHTLDSDFIYTRHFGDVRYRVRSRHNEFVAYASGGVITGPAPLFERFSLGNTITLRGWNKYDLAPAGGNRLAYGSLEYRYSVLQLFYDVGSVWDKGNSRQTSHSIGFGLHSREGDRNGFSDHWFITLGVPVRSGHIQPLNPIFMMGIR